MTKQLPLVGRSNAEKAAVRKLVKARRLMKLALKAESEAKAFLHDSGHRVFETDTHICTIVYMTQTRLDTDGVKAYLARQKMLAEFLKTNECEQFQLSRKG